MFMYQKINTLCEELQNVNPKKNFEDIADEIGISCSYLTNLRKGKNKPAVDVLEKLVIYFGVDMNFFFDHPQWGGVRKDYDRQLPNNDADKNQANAELWKLLYEKQEEITSLRVENERLKKDIVPEQNAHAV